MKTHYAAWPGNFAGRVADVSEGKYPNTMNTQTSTGNRLTGEPCDLITSKVTLTEDASVFRSSATIPFDSAHAAEVTRLLASGHVVIRAWDVLWPADGSAPRVISDTGYLPTPSEAARAQRATAALAGAR